jgi:poly(3-hydroxybutyrate) depolymerase
MTLIAPGNHRASLRHDGLDRSYLLHLPKAAAPLPLVVMLHGSGGSADFAADETGWSELADAESFGVVYPEGLPARRGKAPKFLTNPQEWNDGSGRGRHDDVGFLTAVLDHLAALTDPARVFMTGFSNGAGMTFRFAAEHADRVAAIAPVAGHCWGNDAKPVRPVATFFLIGDSDPLVPPKWRDGAHALGPGRKPPAGRRNPAALGARAWPRAGFEDVSGAGHPRFGPPLAGWEGIAGRAPGRACGLTG